MDVSVIIPVHGGEKWIQQCFDSILRQTALKTSCMKLEVVVFDDASSDATPRLLDEWREKFIDSGIKYVVVPSDDSSPKGVGAAKNEAVKNSTGHFLCFQDIDDVMLPDRIQLQYEACKQKPNALIGSKFRRHPEGSTVRFTDWANNLETKKLAVQIYTSHGPTVIMPTWFCHRDVYNRVGGFVEQTRGYPEDLVFFLKHLEMGGEIFRIDKELLIYTYHQNATTFSVLSDTIWDIRIRHLEKNVLNRWARFTIWNAGKQGRKFVKSLSKENQDKVFALCDVDLNKIGKSYSLYCSKSRRVLRSFPIIHFKEAEPPIIVCVKLGLTKGEFEENLKSLSLNEGLDYIVFS